MLVAEASSVSVVSIVIGVIGLVAVMVSLVIAGFGSRAKTLADQQDKQINALDSRCNQLEIHNRELEQKLGEAKGAIDALQAVVSSHDLITALDTKLENGFAELGVDRSRLRLVK
jgi:predicted PurR-regulated permease PerM